MIQIGNDNNLQGYMAKINNAIDMLNEKHNISVREHLGLGDTANSELRYSTSSSKCEKIGEHNSNNNLHGRGIYIHSSGFIYIGYWNNGEFAPGSYIHIFSDGEFRVGESYLKAGKKWNKYTRYRTNGTTEEYD